jgi:hypothetical protein
MTGIRASTHPAHVSDFCNLPFSTSPLSSVDPIPIALLLLTADGERLQNRPERMGEEAGPGNDDMTPLFCCLQGRCEHAHSNSAGQRVRLHRAELRWGTFEERRFATRPPFSVNLVALSLHHCLDCGHNGREANKD